MNLLRKFSINDFGIKINWPYGKVIYADVGVGLKLDCPLSEINRKDLLVINDLHENEWVVFGNESGLLTVVNTNVSSPVRGMAEEKWRRNASINFREYQQDDFGPNYVIRLKSLIFPSRNKDYPKYRKFLEEVKLL